MVERKCPNHGWIETRDYIPDDVGELVCKRCGEVVAGFRDSRVVIPPGEHQPRPRKGGDV